MILLRVISGPGNFVIANAFLLTGLLTRSLSLTFLSAPLGYGETFVLLWLILDLGAEAF